MTMRELDRFKVIQGVADGMLKPWRAAERLGLTTWPRRWRARLPMAFFFRAKQRRGRWFASTRGRGGRPEHNPVTDTAMRGAVIPPPSGTVRAMPATRFIQVAPATNSGAC
jgi:hypothetical protein